MSFDTCTQLYKCHVLLLKGLMQVAESRYPGGDKSGLRGGQLEAVEIAQVRDGGGPEGSWLRPKSISEG